MSAYILLRNETLKTTRRFAFWVTALAFSAMVTLISVSFHQASVRLKNPRPFELPEAWWRILGDPIQMGTYFAAVVLMLLVASEFSWRTARQNVIDGLSKEQFFLGKLLLLPMLAVLMLAIPLLVGPAIAMLGEGLPAGGWITPAQAKLAGAAALAMLGFMSLAFLFATTIRNSGSAIGVFFLYLVVVERLGGSILGFIREDWAALSRYFPANAFGGLADPARWNPGAPAQAGDMAPVATPTLLGFVIAYILLLWVVSFLVFRRRDL